MMYAMTKPSINFLSSPPSPLTPESRDNEMAQRRDETRRPNEDDERLLS